MWNVMNATAAICVGATMAQAGIPVVDGTLDSSYGDQIIFQNTSTNFGNANDGNAGFANGSELDVASATIAGGHLFLHFGGNLESNYNKLEIFVDARDGGQGRILGVNPDVGFGALQRMGDDGSGNGLRFDAGFAADIYLTIGCGDNGNGGIDYFVDFAELRTDGSGTGGYAGSGTTSDNGNGTIVITPSSGDYGIEVAIDNRNTSGVLGGTGPDCGAPDGEVVGTGVEVKIPLELIDWDFDGLPFDNVRVCAFINSSDHGFVSNQVLGGLGGSDNLGEVKNVDFSAIDGAQNFRLGVVASPCVGAVIGACCFANGDCWEGLTATACDDNRGLFGGEDSVCGDCDLGGGNDCPTDVDGNGATDVDDLLQIIANFGNPCV